MSGGFVDYLVDTGSAWGRVSIDANGRYTISNVPDRSRIRITAHAGLGDVLKQTCGAYAFVEANTVLDVELVRLGSRGSNWAAPTLSGVIFQTTAEGRRPVAGTPVVYYSVFKASFDVYTMTDADGRYEVCGLPLGAGELLAGDCNDAMQRNPVEIRADTNVLDVDLTAMIRDCPR